MPATMISGRKHILCRTGGIAAIVLAPIPFLLCFYDMATTKVTLLPEEALPYRQTRLSALFFVAVVGVALGIVLLLIGRRLRSIGGRASA